jgi:hypothetical protein
MAAAAAENEQGPGDGITGVVDRRILILYGSESGNSEDLAADLEDITERLHFRTDVLEMNDVGLVGTSLPLLDVNLLCSECPRGYSKHILPGALVHVMVLSQPGIPQQTSSKLLLVVMNFSTGQ